MISKDNAMEVYLFGMLYKVASLDQKITEAEKHFTEIIIPKTVKKNVDLDELLRIYANSSKDAMVIIKEASLLLSVREVVSGAKHAITLALFDGKLDESEKKHINEILENAKISQRQILSLWNLAQRNIQEFENEYQAQLKKSKKDSKVLKQELLRTHFHRDEITACPNCEEESLDVFIHEGLEFDYCARGCHGVWTDNGELEKYISEEVGKLPYHKANFDELAESKRICPRCDIPLHQYDYLGEGLMIDICNKCYGSWLDSSELNQVKTLSRKHGLGGKMSALKGFLDSKELKRA